MQPSIVTLTQITEPSGSVLDAAVVKDHLVIDQDDDRFDQLISLWIAAAGQHAERLRGEKLLSQVWEQITNGFPSGRDMLSLRPRPVASVSSVKYRDSGGTEYDFGTSDGGSPEGILEYELIRNPTLPKLRLRSGYDWPTAAETRTRLEVGYGTAEDIPEIVRGGMLLMIGHWFENRTAVVTGTIAQEVPMSARAMLVRPKVG